MKSGRFSFGGGCGRGLRWRSEQLTSRAVLGAALLTYFGSWMAQGQAPVAPAKGSVLDSEGFSGAGNATAQAVSKKPQPGKTGGKAGGKQAEKIAIQPSFAIPVGPLGFATPTHFYFGERFAVVSLNFLDEDSVLFAFRVPGLIAREQTDPEQKTVAERHIRALVLALPEGKVTAESMWVLHDYQRFLWTMKGRKFLLRDRNLLEMGDSALHLDPFLRFPGPINGIQFDPEQHVLITDTTEAPAAERKTAPGSGIAGTVAGPATGATEPVSQTTAATPATASMSSSSASGSDARAESAAMQRLVRVVSLDTRQVMLFSRANVINGTVHLPVDGEGYYETLRGSETRWLIVYDYFKGTSTPVGVVDSDCDPNLDAMAPGIVVASACLPTGARHLTAFARNRDKEHARLWDVTLPPTKVWPQWTTSSDGMRFARATLEVTHPVGIYNPLDDSDVRGQSVQVYDLATGAVLLTTPASPVMDGGGNFALSPSGRRLAVLNDGAIQVFELPPVAAVPPPGAAGPEAKKTAHKP